LTPAFDGPFDELDDELADDALPDPPRPVVKVLGVLILGCLLVALFLGLSKGGEPLWKPARVLFLPAGVLTMAQAALLEGRRGYPWMALAPGRFLEVSLFVCGVGLCGFGLAELEPDGPWLVLAGPMIILAGFLFLREALRGERSWLLEFADGRLGRFFMRAGMWMFALMSPVGVLWCLGVVEA